MAESIDLLIANASQVCVMPAHEGGPQRGQRLGDMGLIEGGAVAIRDGQIAAAGLEGDLSARYEAATRLDAGGGVVLPGLVDPHTHLVWVGDRAAEFEMRLAGATYMQIMAAGGGINNTVQKVRAASVEQIVAETRPRLDRMLAFGATTIEVKTGYGLDVESEVRLLDAIYQLDETHPADLVATFLGAHAIPPEYAGRTDDYVEHIIADMIPAVAEFARRRGKSMPFIDVFCEEGVFDVAQSRRILEAGKKAGMPLKIHADEFAGLGGTKLAVELGAVSADHLVATPPGDIRALATDCNPGTAWCESMQFVIALACRALKLTPAQAIAAATINAAFAVGRGEMVGSLEPGKQADLIILDAGGAVAPLDYRHLGYRFGGNLVKTVIKKGRVIAA